jgi:hypothetical protein
LRRYTAPSLLLGRESCGSFIFFEPVIPKNY